MHINVAFNVWTSCDAKRLKKVRIIINYYIGWFTLCRSVALNYLYLIQKKKKKIQIGNCNDFRENSL